MEILGLFDGILLLLELEVEGLMVSIDPEGPLEGFDVGTGRFDGDFVGREVGFFVN